MGCEISTVMATVFDSNGVLSSDLDHAQRLERAQSRVPTAQSTDAVGIYILRGSPDGGLF